MPDEKNIGEEVEAQAPARRNPLGGPSFPLFKFKGIDVSVHWMWFIAAALWISQSKDEYHSILFPIAACLTAFGIILLHEFGHAFACRQVGGKADYITLWLLGGIAFVQAPPRAGAVLWSIAAGPLVNVVLFPVTWGLYHLGIRLGWEVQGPDVMHFLFHIAWFNQWVLLFNILPIYPLDGGQIVQSLLWFVIGRARSLIVACAIGVLVGVSVIGYVIYIYSGAAKHAAGEGDWYLAIMGIFAMQQSWRGLQYGLAMERMGKYPRIEDKVCPACGERAVKGQLCVCPCGAEFDAFVEPLACPQCGRSDESIRCLFCGNTNDVRSWERKR